MDSDIEILDVPPVPSAASERSTKAKGKQKAVQDNGSNDIEMVGVQKDKKKRKTRDAEKDAETTKAKAAKPKKTKTSPNDAADEGRSKKANPKANSRKHTSTDPLEIPKAKSSQRKEDSEDAAALETEDAAPKKKKRKINLFGGSQSTTFDWNMIQGQVFLFSFTMGWLLTPC